MDHPGRSVQTMRASFGAVHGRAIQHSSNRRIETHTKPAARSDFGLRGICSTTLQLLHLGVFVLAMVTMQRGCQRAWRQLMMNYGKSIAGLSAVNFPLYAKATGVKFLIRLERDH